MTSIRGKLSLLLSVWAAILLPLGGAAVYWSAQSLLVGQFDRLMADKSAALIRTAEFHRRSFRIDPEIAAFAGFADATEHDAYVVTSTAGRELQRSLSLKNEPFPPPPAEANGATPLIRNWTLQDGRKARIRWQSFNAPGTPQELQGPLWLTVVSSRESMDATLRSLSILLLISGGCGILLAAIASNLVLRRGLHPLTRIADQVHGIQIGQNHRAIPTEHLPLELRQIAQKVNELMERVDASLARERRFSSHAAHELRTPLAELLAISELMETWPEERTLEHCAEIREVINEMGALLDRLSLLAKGDAGFLEVNRAPLSPASLVKQVCQRYQGLAESRSIQFECQIAPHDLHTDAALLEVILNNLIGNATSYAPPHSTVRIEADAQQLTVSNVAPHLEESDLPKLFERFWRKHSTRQTPGHSGLGLSIVSACCEALAASHSASLSAEQRLAITIHW